MDTEKIAEVVSFLEKFAQRPAMYMGSISLDRLKGFFAGMDIAIHLVESSPPFDARQEARMRRCWQPTNEAWPMEEMEERGYTEEAMFQEIIAIELEMWKLFYEEPSKGVQVP